MLTEPFFSLTTPLGENVLLLERFQGEERLSGLFSFRLEMLSDKRDISFDDMIGQSVTITVRLSDDGSDVRHINGVVGRFTQGETREAQAIYYADVYPWLWLYTMTSECRIFQEMTVPDIIDAVLKKDGLEDSMMAQLSLRRELSSMYEPREYCVQYNETSFEFICRLMEEEGIFYFFEHEADKHTMVLGDDIQVFKPCPGAGTLLYGVVDQFVLQNRLRRLSLEKSVIVGGVDIRDFDFEKPSTTIEATVASAQSSPFKMYGYPQGLEQSQGEVVVDGYERLRVESFESRQDGLHGESLAPALNPGFTFKLDEHYRDDLNGTEYYLARVSHAANHDSYTNTFDAIPAKTPFRPRRVRAKPKIGGTQTAIVVGPSGEEIYTDKYGRVKAQFHWDREGKSDESSSCWIRVAHGWAGKSWGQIYIPRIGQEVVVSFEEGDPDRPLITGSVYNAEQTVPYALPDEQTKSTIKSDSSKGGGGFNELRFEDKKDEEEIYFHAERDFNRVVQNNDTLTVGLEDKDPGDQTIEIQNDRTVTLNEGSDTLTIKKGDRTETLEEGGDTLTIKQGDRTVTLDAGSDALAIKQGDMEIKIDAGKATTEAAMSIELKVGSNSIKIDTSGITVKGTMIKVEGSASAEVKSANTTVSGDGMLTLKGGLVKIN